VEGRAQIRCRIDEFGKLQDCTVSNEAPLGLGFGQAAVAMSGAFLMRPMTRDGQPVSGGQINIPIAFRLPADAPPIEPGPPTSPRALDLARKLMATNTSTESWSANLEAAARELEFISRDDVSDDARAAIAKDLRAVFPAHLPEVKELTARLFAGALSEADIAGLLAFYETPVGRAVNAETDDTRAIATMIQRQFHRLSIKAAQEAFCATRDCSDQPDVTGLARDASGPKPAVTIPSPTWSQEPTTDQVWQARPDLAKSLEIGGAVRMTCTVATGGALSKCAVAHETPQGLGFGWAARNLAPYYRLTPALIAQGAIGETVAVFVAFDAPDQTGEDFSGASPRSPQSMTLAREQVALSDTSAANRDAYRQMLVATHQRLPGGVTQADVDAVNAVIGKGGEVAIARVRDLQAAEMTRRFTDAELTAILQFWKSPASLAWKAKAGDLNVGIQLIEQRVERAIWVDTGVAFCRDHGCPPPRLTAQPQPQPAIGASPAASTRTP
jgi:hypothetical protein